MSTNKDVQVIQLDISMLTTKDVQVIQYNVSSSIIKDIICNFWAYQSQQ